MTPTTATVVAVLVVVLAAVLGAFVLRRRQDSVAEEARPERRDPEFIASYAFPPGMIGRALEWCPAGTSADLVEEGLRQFFLAAAADADLRASMPSRVVDEGWHEFITFTRPYQEFCQRAFGRFLHHQPEYLMEPGEATANQTTVLWSTWRHACLSAGLDPAWTRTAPALFAADRAAGVEGAKTYVATCSSRDACTAGEDVVCVRHEVRDQRLAPAPAGPAARMWVESVPVLGRRLSPSRSTREGVASDSRSAAFWPVFVAGGAGSSGHSSCGSGTSCGGGGCGSG